MAQNSVKALPLSTFSSASITSSYQLVNGTGFLAPVFLIHIVNDSTTAITISYDGTTDNEYVRAGSDLVIPSQSNSQPNAHYSLWSSYTKVYVKGTAGTGTIAISGYYV